MDKADVTIASMRNTLALAMRCPVTRKKTMGIQLLTIVTQGYRCMLSLIILRYINEYRGVWLPRSSNQLYAQNVPLLK